MFQGAAYLRPLSTNAQRYISLFWVTNRSRSIRSATWCEEAAGQLNDGEPYYTIHCNGKMLSKSGCSGHFEVMN
jgi:hypothetical protein